MNFEHGFDYVAFDPVTGVYYWLSRDKPSALGEAARSMSAESNSEQTEIDELERLYNLESRP